MGPLKGQLQNVCGGFPGARRDAGTTRWVMANRPTTPTLDELRLRTNGNEDWGVSPGVAEVWVEESAVTMPTGPRVSSIAFSIAESTARCHVRAASSAPLLAAQASASKVAMRASRADLLTSEVSCRVDSGDEWGCLPR